MWRNEQPVDCHRQRWWDHRRIKPCRLHQKMSHSVQEEFFGSKNEGLRGLQMKEMSSWGCMGWKGK